MQQNETIYVAKKSITMEVITVKPKETAELKITAVSTNQPKVNEILRNNSSPEAREKVVATILLPKGLLDKVNKNKAGIQRITVFVFDNDKLFLNKVRKHQSNSKEENISKEVNSKIVAASIKGVKLTNLSKDEQVQTTFSTSTPSFERKVECVYWDFGGASMFISFTAFPIQRIPWSFFIVICRRSVALSQRKLSKTKIQGI